MNPPRKTRFCLGYSLEKAQKELTEARRLVAELEGLVEELLLKDRSRALGTEHNQKTASILEDASQFGCSMILDDTPETMPLQGLTLQLIVSEFLDLADVHKSCQVCWQWQNDIDRKWVWKRVAARIAPSLLLDIDTLEEGGKSFDYKAISKSLAFFVDTRNGTDQSHHLWIPRPQLAPNQLFLIVEANAAESVVGSWHQTFEYWVGSESEFGFKLIPNDEKAIDLPMRLKGSFEEQFRGDDGLNALIDTPFAIYQRLSFTMRLLRLDTGQSLCFHLNDNEWDFDAEDYVFVDTDIGEPAARNDEGLRARKLWSLRQYNHITACLRCKAFPITHDSMRLGNVDFRQLRYRLGSLECDFVVHTHADDPYSDFQNLSELLISLEGMNWS